MEYWKEFKKVFGSDKRDIPALMTGLEGGYAYLLLVTAQMPEDLTITDVSRMHGALNGRAHVIMDMFRDEACVDPEDEDIVFADFDYASNREKDTRVVRCEEIIADLRKRITQETAPYGFESDNNSAFRALKILLDVLMDIESKDDAAEEGEPEEEKSGDEASSDFFNPDLPPGEHDKISDHMGGGFFGRDEDDEANVDRGPHLSQEEVDGLLEGLGDDDEDDIATDEDTEDLLDIVDDDDFEFFHDLDEVEDSEDEILDFELEDKTGEDASKEVFLTEIDEDLVDLADYIGGKVSYYRNGASDLGEESVFSVEWELTNISKEMDEENRAVYTLQLENGLGIGISRRQSLQGRAGEEVISPEQVIHFDKTRGDGAINVYKINAPDLLHLLIEKPISAE